MSKTFKRLLFIVGGILIVFLLVWNMLVSENREDSVPVASIVRELGMSNTAIVDGGSSDTTTFPATGSNDEPVQTRDFLKDPDVVDWDGSGTFMLGAGLIDGDEAYQLFYYQPDQSISIVLFAEPFGKVRQVAESQLLERLGIKKETACKMNVRVNVPGSASETVSGKNLGLSFCPNSVKL
jgi:hypothetical protein